MSTSSSLDEVIDHLYSILIMCGIDHHDIMLTLERISKQATRQEKTYPKVLNDKTRLHIDSTAVVAMWRRNERFLDHRGDPAILLPSDEARNFETLVLESRVSFGASEIRTYLLDLGTVREGESGALELREESVLVTTSERPGVVSSDVTIGHVSDFLRTVRGNLSGESTDRPKAFERACYGRLSENLIPVFSRLVRERGQQYVDSIDEWLDRHPPDDENRSVLVGSGAYAIVGSNLS